MQLGDKYSCVVFMTMRACEIKMYSVFFFATFRGSAVGTSGFV